MRAYRTPSCYLRCLSQCARYRSWPRRNDAAPTVLSQHTRTRSGCRSRAYRATGAWRCRGHVVRHEPQPRQRVHRNGEPEPVRRPSAPARVDERTVRRGQGKEPEQLLPADLREPPQALQLLVGEHGATAQQPPARAQISLGQEPTRPYPPDFSRVLRRPLVDATLKSGSIAESRRGAHVSGGLSHRRPKIIVDQVPPESIRAAAHDIACRASEVHVLAVGTCAIN